ncbi:hypothetical protein BDZ89DRAFT_838269 [Hymenopellis radicata]|nr:hypothetical protein BDZ89DRAFT_838269 [Hymenopellis radicata]
MKNFGKRLIKASKTGDGAIWPIVALFVVEAKAAGIVDGTCWDGTAPPDDAIGINNVDNIVPQLRLYSNDTCCQYVFLTDYLRTVLFRVKDNGLEKPGGTSKQHQVRNRVFGRHGVIHVENTYQDRGTRALLFATGLKVLRKTLQLTAEK